MAIFVSKSKKRKYDMSRIPYGNMTVGPYIIRPYTSSLQILLDEQLKELLNSEPKCVDGQNGDVLDSIIICWEKRAKNGISKQRAYHAERIKDLVMSRESNLQNAKDWLEIDKAELDKLKTELSELEFEYNEYNNEMSKW